MSPLTRVCAGTGSRWCTRSTSAAAAAPCAWPTRCARSGSCANGCAARRSGWSVRSAGVTRTRTCRPTSRNAGTSTYRELSKPLDAAAFVDPLREEMHAELAALYDALPAADWLQVADRPAGAIKLAPIEAAPEPRNLRRLKAEVGRRWGMVPLIDMLKEAVLRTGCLSVVTSVAGRGTISPEDLAERLMLAIYGYGTNTGLRAVATGQHSHSEDEIRYVRRRYLTAQAARAIAIEIANATFTARQQAIWGAGSTAVASDSTHFGAFDQNIFTEWHSRYGGRGVLIYWHVERGSVVVHSQHLTCSASEVHAMVEGAIRHGTSMSVEANYVDSHGQSEIGVRHHQAARLRPAAADQADQQGQAVPAGRRRTGRLPRPGAGANPADPLGADRPAVRPDDQIRHRDPHRHRLHRGDPAPLHPQRHPPHLPGDARSRPCAEDHLRRPLPAHEGPAAGDQRGPERRGVLEPRQQRDLLRQGRRHRHQPPRRAGDGRAVPADPAGRHGLREHPHAPRRARRPRLGRRAQRRGPARPDPAVLDPCPALRRGSPGHDRPAHPRRWRTPPAG